MKPTNFSTLGIIVFICLFLAACSGMRQMARNADDVRIEATPEILEVHSDSIEVEIRGQIPEGYLHRRAHIRFEPTLRYEGQTYPLREYVVKAEDADEDLEADQVIRSDEGGTFTINDKFPFEPDMRVSNLCMVLNIRKDSDYETLRKCHTTPDDTIASGVRTISRTVQNTDDILFSGEREPERLAQDAKIHFEINRAGIRRSEKEGESMKNVWDFTQTPELFFRNVDIHAFASPDGPTDFNETLSQNREDNTFEFLKSELLDRGFEEVHDTDFYSQSTTEDWEGFVNAVRADQDMPEREWALEILESDMSLDDKEDELRTDEDVWDYLADNIFPPLRRSDITLAGVIAMRDEHVVMEVGDENLDSLNKRELLVYAYNQETLEDEMEVHEYFAERFEDDWIGYGNIARMHLLMYRRDGGDEHLESAGNNLDQAFDINPDEGSLHNNRGVLQRWQGHYHQARESFNKAKELGVDVDNNMGIVQINLANYEASIESFPEDQCDYNVALAYTLNGNNEQALETLDCIPQKTAEDFYLRAVVAAREGDQDLLTTSLTRAIENDEKFREKAEKDIEFARYRNRTSFQNAIQ